MYHHTVHKPSIRPLQLCDSLRTIAMFIKSPTITKLTFGRNASAIGIGQARPSLTWRFAQHDQTSKDWVQKSYELEITRGEAKRYKVDSDASVDVPWPREDEAVRSREKVGVAIRACGKDGSWTDWYEDSLETALLDAGDWSADFVTTDIKPAGHLPKRPFYTRTTFSLDPSSLDRIKDDGARVYATALGVYQLELNGKRVGDHVLAPGWQSYDHRLHCQTHVVPSELFKAGENVMGAVVGEGWYAGHLTWRDHLRNLWGEEIGVRVQLEVGGQTVASGKGWEWAYGPLLGSELYDGETFDASLVDPDWSSTGSRSSWRPVNTLTLLKSTSLIAPEAPPIRRVMEVRPVELITTPKGKKIIDFGQNVAGWAKLKTLPAGQGTVTMRFAEVLDRGEIGMRPLRSAKATDTIFLGPSAVSDWEPVFTTHGFRYVEVTGLEVKLEDFTAVVVYSDMERLGDFTCSHETINKLHENVVWGLRGNFVGVPTDW